MVTQLTLQAISPINTKVKVKGFLTNQGLSNNNIKYIQNQQGICGGTDINDLSDIKSDDWTTIGKMAASSGNDIPF